MHRRRFRRLPGAEHLSPKLVRLDVEASKLAQRLVEAEARRIALNEESLTQQAIATDRADAAAAARKGHDASELGTPAHDILMDRRARADRECQALDTALTSVEEEQRLEFARMAGDSKYNGQAAITPAAEAYRAAIDALCSARLTYWSARAVRDYIRVAGNASADHPVDYAGPAAPQVQLPGSPGRPERGAVMGFEGLIDLASSELKEA